MLCCAWMMISSTGCGPMGGGAPTSFTSPDGRIIITTPAGWEKGTFKSELGKIRISNPAKHGYGIVIIENKADLKDGLTLSGYAKIILKLADKKTAATGTTEDRTVSEPSTLTINGYPATRYEIRATVQNTKFVYSRTFVQTPDLFVQVLLWTVPSHFAEDQPDFDSIAGSLKQVK